MPQVNDPTGDTLLANDALQFVIRNEGYSEFPHPDANGTLAIGYGTNLDRRGLSKGEAELLARRDINKAIELLSTQVWFNDLASSRKIALIDMSYCIGRTGVLTFTHMIMCLKVKDYEGAARSLLTSRFATECPDRASRDAHILRTGELPSEIVNE